MWWAEVDDEDNKVVYYSDSDEGDMELWEVKKYMWDD